MPRLRECENMTVRVADILSKERGRMSLYRHPVRVLYLFMCYISTWVGQTLTYLLWNPMVYCIFIPLVTCFLAFSMYGCPSTTSYIFTVLDTEHHGRITGEDLERYYSGTLGWSSGAGHEAASTFPEGAGALTASQFESWWHHTKDLYRQDAYFSHGRWREAEYYLADVIYWVVLGILSSAGFGTGIHSGLLFLFPHIYLTCRATTTCGNTNFWNYPVNPLYGPRERVFMCISPVMKSTEGLSTSILDCVLKVLPACIAWGFGTALGELPPYVLSYAAAKQGSKHEHEQASSYNVLNYMKEWTFRNIERYGFFAVLLLAAWPNMAFDLCGMACGQFLMPFWTFFIATVIGKAVIKVTLQSVFFVTLFSGNNVENFLVWAGDLMSGILPARIHVKGVVDKAVGAIVKAREGIANRAKGHLTLEDDTITKEESPIVLFFNLLVILAVALFAKSIVESFAISVQEKEDEKLLVTIGGQLEEEISTWGTSSLSDDELLRLLYDIKKRAHYGVPKSNRKNLRTRKVKHPWLFRALFPTFNASLCIETCISVLIIVWGCISGNSLAPALGASLLFHTLLWHKFYTNHAGRWVVYVTRMLMLIAALYTYAFV